MASTEIHINKGSSNSSNLRGTYANPIELASGTDLNTITKSGMYLLKVNTNNYINIPTDIGRIPLEHIYINSLDDKIWDVSYMDGGFQVLLEVVKFGGYVSQQITFKKDYVAETSIDYENSQFVITRLSFNNVWCSWTKYIDKITIQMFQWLAQGFLFKDEQNNILHRGNQIKLSDDFKLENGVLKLVKHNIFYKNENTTEMTVSSTSYERFHFSNVTSLVGKNITVKLKVKSSNDINRAYVSLANNTNTTQMLKFLDPIGMDWKDIEITTDVDDVVVNTLIVATGRNYQSQVNGNNSGTVWVKDIEIIIND